LGININQEVDAMFGATKSGNLVSTQVQALENINASVMIADNNLNITYTNPSVVALLREAEPELQKELTRFSMATLIGSNIDVFHKVPSYQRNMLATMSKPHSAMIKVGKRSFDLLVSPLVVNGARNGFVVEWSDARERLKNVDYAEQFKALGRSQAMIEFTPDGIIQTANTNFLTAMGYTLPEIEGKHHSLFVESAYGKSPDYKVFWDALRAGTFQAAQFKRVGKGGKEVWIEGAYNPILDQNGKVTKVVKFATDVTAQVQLLNNLKVLIDQNFGEIDQAIGKSSSEARSASLAATDTSNNVNSVAASAEELASSISEISKSMGSSQTATEHAAQQIAGVAKSTETLANAAQAMNGIVALIRNIASQINLLALNATIEAARAGDAGKGFAVVASEVKNLAVQAAKATEQIATEIDSIQVTSNAVVGALDAIREAVTTVRESVAVTASAVEEQSAVTRNMSANMQSASGAVATVSASVKQIETAVAMAGSAMAKTKEAARILAR